LTAAVTKLNGFFTKLNWKITKYIANIMKLNGNGYNTRLLKCFAGRWVKSGKIRPVFPIAIGAVSFTGS
jgi:hypothetical protein